ncbi:MAG: alpha/beta hydrolase [Bacteroidetes bacterium]|nr:MAG: alpha/beta hydrolase [Bacteroidota bacterium]
MKKILFRFVKVLLGLYILVCGLLYFTQEKLIFFPQKLEQDYTFQFDQDFKEFDILTNDRTRLNGLLFKSDSSRGLIFYLHGNSSSLESWGHVAKTYTNLNYDVFMLDYRGFGKSDGNISSQAQLFNDNETAYRELKKKYNEDQIIILGYSVGSGLASKLASNNNPRLLILQAPYYSLIDMMRRTYSAIPTFILKYKFETNEYLKKCDMPVTIFHGKQDRVISYESSVLLKEDFKSKITLIPLENQGHNGMTDNEQYKKVLKELLAN